MSKTRKTRKRIQVYVESGLGPDGAEDGYVYGTHITCEGDCRGSCGIRHRTESGAIKCINQDADGCAWQGGYSDLTAHLYDGDRIVAYGHTNGDFYAY